MTSKHLIKCEKDYDKFFDYHKKESYARWWTEGKPEKYPCVCIFTIDEMAENEGQVTLHVGFVYLDDFPKETPELIRFECAQPKKEGKIRIPLKISEEGYLINPVQNATHCIDVKMPEVLPSHIPHGAVEKTDYIKSIAAHKILSDERFFAFDGKTYYIYPNYPINGMDWNEFCEDMKMP